MVAHSIDRSVGLGRGASGLARWAVFAVLSVFMAGLLASCGGGATLSESKAPPQATSRKGGAPKTPGSGTAGGPTVPAGETPKVALLLPMTGPYQKIGVAMRQAAEMALFDIADKKFTLTPIDTQGTPQGAREAARQAKAAGAHLVLGPLFSASVKEVKEEFLGTNVNVIAFSTDALVAGDNTFLMGFLVKPQIDRIVAYASKQGLKRIAVVAPEGPYGQAVIDAFGQATTAAGVTNAGTLLYPAGTTEMNKMFRSFTNYNARAGRLLAVMAKTAGKTDAASRRARARAKRTIKIKPPEWDAVIIADGGARLLLATSMLAFYDVDPDKVQYLGTGQWDDPSVAREPNLKGAWFAAPPPEARLKFETKFKAEFKTDPPRIATLAYDAVALAAVLARAEGGANFSKEAITSSNGFVGIDGIFRFLPSGLSERGLAVLEVAEEEFRMIGTAPSSFETPTE